MGNIYWFKGKPRITWVTWLVLIVLLAWCAWSFLPIYRPIATISYSSFIKQVKAGYVSKVEIKGNEIDGWFLKSTSSPQKGRGLSLIIPTLQQPGSFKTIFPESIGDSSLIPLLTAHEVEVNVSPPPGLIMVLFTRDLPVALLILLVAGMGFAAWYNRTIGIKLGGIWLHLPRINEVPQVTFADVAGNNDAKARLQMAVDYLRGVEKYNDSMKPIPRCILLVGSPESGKTLLARAVAGEAGIPFLRIDASELSKPLTSEGAMRIHELFIRSKISSSAIIFIDKLDAIGEHNKNGERQEALNQLLEEMDRRERGNRTLILAASDRPELLDPDLLRTGRFDWQIAVSLPKRAEREAFLSLRTHNMHLTPDVDLRLIARTTTGFNSDDLANLCQTAALRAHQQHHPQVSMDDFEEALDRLLLVARNNLLLNDNVRRVVAYHEAGHALIAWLTPNADVLQRVTIIQHEPVLGTTEQISSTDGFNVNQEYLLARMAVMLGGRAAEEIAIGDLTIEAENDLLEATRLARRMVTRWGMGRLGPVALNSGDEGQYPNLDTGQWHEYSEEMAARIDNDVLQLLRGQYQAVLSLLEGSRTKLDQLVEVLLADETIERDHLTKIIGPRSVPADKSHPRESGISGA